MAESLLATESRHQERLGMERIATFSDSIFAFSMTLLVTGIHLPNLPEQHIEVALPRLLIREWRPFAIYVLSFLNIAHYWVLHHLIFLKMVRADKLLIWLNIFLLLSVTFLPYPTALMGKYGRDAFTAMVYGVTLVFNYLFLILVTLHAYRDHHLLDEEAGVSDWHFFRFRLCVPFLCAILGTLLSLFFSRLSFLFYFAVLLLNAVPLAFLKRKCFPKKQTNPDARLPKTAQKSD
jgi:uncharacterized membrane protein